MGTSIQHWQLRDLVAFSDDGESLYHVMQSSIRQYSIEKEEDTVVENLSFNPASFAYAHGYLAAGGQNAQLYVSSTQNLDVEYPQSTGGSINNAITISKTPEWTRMIVANNDRRVKVYDLPTMELVSTVPLGVPVNYAAESHDGRFFLAVTDSRDVFIRDPRNGYREIARLRECHDAAFSCSWNKSSTQFAVASQEGAVYVWDVRSQNVLSRFQSQQYPHGNGACRSVKFSHVGAVDLLVFTEHMSFFHVVDARHYNEHQVVQTRSTRDRNITGVAFSPDCSKLAVGLEMTCCIYDVDTSLRRSFADGALI